MPRESRKPKKTFQLKGRVIFFATGNFHKFDEARKILAKYSIAAAMLRAKNLEIQSDNIKEIAEASVLDAYSSCHLPVVVEDAGLFIEALKEFPGPYAAYVYKTISNPGILKLMTNVKNRKATFRSAIAYYDETLTAKLFEGEAKGEIIHDERWGTGKSGFGFDPIFSPSGSQKTFAEMPIEEKNGFSHRADAFRKFAKWYRKQQPGLEIG